MLHSATRFAGALAILVAGFGCNKLPTSTSSESPAKPADALATSGTAGQESHPVTVANADFEQGETGWNFKEARGIATISGESAFEGKGGLLLRSVQDDAGIAVSTPKLPVEPGCSYDLSWQARVREGTGTSIYLRFFDNAGKELSKEEGRVLTERGDKWAAYKLSAVPPFGATQMDITIRRPSGRSPKYTIDVDAFKLTRTVLPNRAPWAASYKLRPNEKDRLTAADVIGPDGLVYPDFTFAGVEGGIPNPPVRVNLKDLGAQPGMDISKLLETAAARVASAGGGAVLIDEGEYYLDEPVMIFDSNVTIRGSGSSKTRLMFRYHIPQGEIRFFRLKPGQSVGQAGGIEFHANPKNLVAVELLCDNKSLQRRVRADHWGDTFSLRVSVPQVLRESGTGTHRFVAIAEYSGSKRVEQPIDLNIVSDGSGETAPSQLGAINFVGRGAASGNILLTQDGKRGDTTLKLAQPNPVAAGDFITVIAPATDRWKKVVGYTSTWGIQAQNIYKVTKVDGATVTLDQPLRIPFPVVDGSYVQKLRLITNCGIEALHLEQVVVPNQGPRGPIDPLTIWYPIEDLWTSGVIFSYAWNGWTQGVTIRNVCRNAAYFPLSKHIEVRDCLFDDALFKGGGGTGYVGFDRTWDSLIDNIVVKGMRHAPNNQWNAAGNVVRNSRFEGSDGQWHAGFTVENLYENNFIDARGNGGSYGHGLYASGPSTGLHGPQGPRNVAYNNDIVARNNCVHMLGGNEGWLILHNRFVTEKGCAVLAKEKSFDHVIQDNVFVLRQAVPPAVQLGSDAVGVELIRNAFYGVKPPLVGFAGNRLSLAVDEGNTITADIPSPIPARPAPQVPSIYQWQRDHADAIRKQRESFASKPAAP